MRAGHSRWKAIAAHSGLLAGSRRIWWLLDGGIVTSCPSTWVSRKSRSSCNPPTAADYGISRLFQMASDAGKILVNSLLRVSI